MVDNTKLRPLRQRAHLLVLRLVYLVVTGILASLLLKYLLPRKSALPKTSTVAGRDPSHHPAILVEGSHPLLITPRLRSWLRQFCRNINIPQRSPHGSSSTNVQIGSSPTQQATVVSDPHTISLIAASDPTTLPRHQTSAGGATFPPTLQGTFNCFKNKVVTIIPRLAIAILPAGTVLPGIIRHLVTLHYAALEFLTVSLVLR